MRGLYAAKPWFVGRLRRVEDLLVARRVSPDALTWWAVGVAAAAATATVAGEVAGAPAIWIAVAPLALARLALNALDGSVARRTGAARPFGAALNEICDRISDAAFLAPLALVAPPALALGALACAFAASLAGVLAWAVAGRRDHGGPMGKADRMLVVGLAAIVAPFAPVAWTAACAIVAAGSAVTVAARVTRIRAGYAPPRARPQSRSASQPQPGGFGRAQRLLAQGLVEIPETSRFDEERIHALGR